MGLRWGRDRCMFLDRSNDCMIYEHRPLACREHPFTVSISKSGALQGLKLSKIVECLYELDGHLKRRQLTRVSRWNERESSEYGQRVRSWNRDARGSRTRAQFMAFLGLDWNQGGDAPELGQRVRSAPDPFG